MTFVAPAAAIALVTLIAPIVIHVLVRQRAARIAFPTLRFIQPHRLASVRRRALDDAALLAVRAAILAIAVGAVAGPFVMTEARRRAWDARTIRADVSDADGREGLVRAVAWLGHQPAGRREIVVRGAFPIGSLTDADIAVIPVRIGLRFERTATLPSARTLPAPAVVHEGRIVERETTLNADGTSVRDIRTAGPATSSVSIDVPPDQQPAADELRAILLTERVPVPAADHRARIAFGSTAATAGSVSTGWIADAAARVARDRIGDGDLHFASDANQLVVSTAMAPTDVRAPGLVRAVARSLAVQTDHTADEVAAVSDSHLRAWTRAPGPAEVPAADTIERDDRRWLWAAVLILVGLESWLRRQRQRTETVNEAPRAA
jgi:hypothetical protein